MNYCIDCGNKLEKNMKFCGNCGIELSNEEVNVEEKNEIKEFRDNYIKERLAKEKREKVEKEVVEKELDQNEEKSEKKAFSLLLKIYIISFIVLLIMKYVSENVNADPGGEKIGEWVGTTLLIPVFVLIGAFFFTIILNIWTSYGRSFLYNDRLRMFYKFSSYALIGGLIYIGFGILSVLLV